MRKWRKWFGAGSRPEPDPAQTETKTATKTATPAQTPIGAFADGPVDPGAAAFVADPYPVYAELRARGGLAELATGGFLVTRHADIAAAFTHPALGNAPSRFSTLGPRNRAKYAAADLAAHIPPFLDMPGHKLPRQALSRAFFRTFRAQEPGLSARAEAALPASGTCDLIADLARPFALDAMRDFVGLEGDAATLKPISEAFFHLFAPITDPAAFAETNRRLETARGLFAEAIAARRAAAGDDLISGLLAHQAEAPELSDAQIADCALLVFADGIENIEAGIAMVFDRLSRDGASAGETAIREALRLDTPGQIVPRVAREDMRWLGQDITAGTPVFLALGSANRDGAVFADPDSFVPGRAETSVIFGLGRHRCIGEPLALSLIGAMVGALQERGAVQAGDLATAGFHARFGHRWPRACPITLPG